MKRQILYIKNRGKYCLYGLCFSLIFLLSLTYSAITMAQDSNWKNPQILLNFDWVLDLDVYSLSNILGMPGTPVLAIDQGRSGFQAQAPEGIQVLSARSKHTLYSFWSRPAQEQLGQSYYPVYLNSYQQDPYQLSTYLQDPLAPFYDEIYWYPKVSSSTIGPTMFYAEPYWHPSAGIGPSSSGQIGPSMFYGDPYWHSSLGGFSMNPGL